MKEYSRKIENLMYNHYRNLSEKDKRLYAAVEAVKLRHVGIANLFDCCQQTVSNVKKKLGI